VSTVTVVLISGAAALLFGRYFLRHPGQFLVAVVAVLAVLSATQHQ
jgi:hypothetical protein